MNKMLFAAAVAAIGMTLSAAPAAKSAAAKPGFSLAKMGDAAKGFEVVYTVNPKVLVKNDTVAYTSNNSKKYANVKIKRIAYAVYKKDKKGIEQWLFVSMDPFTQNINQIGVPVGNTKFQCNVKNLEVKTNVKSVKAGKIPVGNIEFWGKNYGQTNATKVPGASDRVYDFGDVVSTGGGYGSMQVHNFAAKQTIFSYSGFRGDKCFGIGNAPGQNTDWTFDKSIKDVTDAELVVLIRK